MSLPEEDLAARGRSIFERLRQEQDPESDTLNGGADADTPSGEAEAGHVADEAAAEVAAEVVADVGGVTAADTGAPGTPGADEAHVAVGEDGDRATVEDHDAQPPAIGEAGVQLLPAGENALPASTGEIATGPAGTMAAVVTEQVAGGGAADGVSPGPEPVGQAAGTAVVGAAGSPPAPERAEPTAREGVVVADGVSPGPAPAERPASEVVVVAGGGSLALEPVGKAAGEGVVVADGGSPAPEPAPEPIGEALARQEVASPPASTPEMAPPAPPAPEMQALRTSLRQDLEDAASLDPSFGSGRGPEPGSGVDPAAPPAAPESPPDLDPQRFVRPLPRVLAIANQKGGVGKTTTTVNLGASLAVLGYRVLVIDLDPQGNATTGLGINSRNLESSIYDVILHDVPLEDCVEATQLRNLFVAPATIDLAGAEIELVPAFSRELRLRRALEEVRSDYDFVLIDCPPSLGLLTVNALSAATEVAVPIQCEYYALEGLGQLLRNVNLVQSNLNPKLELSAIVLTMYDGRTKLAEQVADEVRQHFGDKVCRNVVPRTVRLSEAPSFGQPIIVFDPSSRGALAYRELAMEVSGGPPQRTG